jgi:hypothetical protein
MQTSTNTSSYLTGLPSDIIFSIFDYLPDNKNILNVGIVSHSLNNLTFQFLLDKVYRSFISRKNHSKEIDYSLIEKDGFLYRIISNKKILDINFDTIFKLGEISKSLSERVKLWDSQVVELAKKIN